MERRRAIGLAALVVLGGAVGFAVASPAMGKDFVNIGSVADSDHVYALDAEEGVVRFEMQAADTAIDPAASFALYDPEDAFVGFYQLDAAHKDLDVHIDPAGQWVVVVYELRESELHVLGDDKSVLDTTQLVPMETLEKRVTIASADGAAINELDTVNARGRPASATLDIDGAVTNLNGDVRSTDGAVLTLTALFTEKDAEGNTFATGGTQTFLPQNLASGAFNVALAADTLTGQIDLVLVHYVRDELPPTPPTPIECEAEPEEEEDEEGGAPGLGGGQSKPEHEASQKECVELVTTDGLVRLEQGVPVAVMVPAGASSLEFLFDDVAMVDLSVFGPDDSLVSYLHLGADYAPSYYQPWDWSGYEWQSSDETASVAIEAAGEYVIYTRALWGEEGLVQIAGADGETQARELETGYEEISDHSIATLEGKAYTVALTTPLVDLYVGDYSFVDASHSLVVTGPAGDVLTSHRSVAAFGLGLEHEFAMYPENFVTGDYSVTWEAQSVGSGLDLVFITYER